MNSPFDAHAATYDRDFSFTKHGRLLRASVQARLAGVFKAGDRILEVNCGTGEDALWMARRGIRVTATDVSRSMRDIAARKAGDSGLGQWIEVRHLDLARPELPVNASIYDGAYSGFGGLNCVADLNPAFSLLARAIRPGGRLVIVVLGRWCLWEILWHLLHGETTQAFRRLSRAGIDADLGAGRFAVWYHSTERLRHALLPAFRLERLQGIGVFIPPTYLQAAILARPRIEGALFRLERMLAGRAPASRWGDHILLQFERTRSSLRPQPKAVVLSAAIESLSS